MDYQRVLEKIEEWTTQLWKVGMVEHPLFTLHGQDHSQKILSNLDKIIAVVKPTKELNDCEWFCLRAAALLHDLGMLYDYDQLMLDLGCNIPGTRKQHLDALHNFIGQYADQRCADGLRTAISQKMEARPWSKADLMRRLHGTISFYLIVKYKKELEMTENQIFQPIATIARSHTGVRFPLHNTDSVTIIGTSPVRTSFLGALLSLADEVDFFGSRVPDEIFQFYANRVVLDSGALVHWIKHYYVTGVEFGRESYEATNKLLVRIHADVPNEQVSNLLNSFLSESTRKLVQYGLADAIARYSDIGSVSVLPEIRVTSVAKALPREIEDRVTIQRSADQEIALTVHTDSFSGKRFYSLADFPDNIPGKWVIIAGDRRDAQRNTWPDILAQGGSIWDVCYMASLSLPADTIVIGDKYQELIKHLLEEENRNVILVGSPSSNLIIREFHRQHRMGLYRFVVDEGRFDEEQRIIEHKEFINMTSDEVRELVAGFQCSEYISPCKRSGIPATPQTGIYNGFVGLAQHPYHNSRVAIVAGGTKSYSTMYALSVLSSAEIMKYPLGTLFRVTTRPDLPIGLNAYKETQVEWLERPYQIQEIQKQLSVDEVSSHYGTEYDRLVKWVEDLANVCQR